MRIAIHLFGREVAAIELTTTVAQPDDEPEPGPPFGFSGAAGLHTDLAEDTSTEDAHTQARPRRSW
ncbi:hypothetical protein [uncultured Thermomonospora sp.]|uniref:hypothetical protein n=1 Tax=uncultured Thermomonospora sp. TaxID=671175 RepID=UPI00259AF493|nr:hypothetical protein [uncultured Thermomonospora sp.]